MRILIVHPGPSWSVADVFEGWREALTGLSQRVATFNLGSRLTFYSTALQEIGEPDADGVVQLRKAVPAFEQAVELAVNGLKSAAYQFWPDVVVVVSYFYVNAALLDLLRDRGHRVVLVHTESPYQDDEQLALAQHADLNLINDPTNLDAFRAIGPAEYVPQSYRPTVHHPGTPDPALACDLAFVGTGFPSRIEFFERMDLTGLDVLLAGQWQMLSEDSPLRKHLGHDDNQSLDNHETAAVYRAAKSSLNLYRREAERPELAAGWAMGPREIELAATGCFFLRDPRPEGDELLPMLPTFTGPEDASEQLRWWLAREPERQAAARMAREAVAERTFTTAAARLLELLDRQPVNQ